MGFIRNNLMPYFKQNGVNSFVAEVCPFAEFFFGKSLWIFYKETKLISFPDAIILPKSNTSR